MRAFSKSVLRFLFDEDGATMVEYAVFVLGIFLAALTVITALGQSTAADLHGQGSPGTIGP